MKNFGLVVLLSAFSLVIVGPLDAELCTIDAVPAATLLLPYFEVDFVAGRGKGVTTLFSINNASDEATVAHVTLWTNWTYPTIDFDLFLSGYDVQTINLHDVFRFGRLPVTAHFTNDPGDMISPHGMDLTNNPQWDSGPGDFPGCDNQLPFPNDGVVVTGPLLDRIQLGHTGQAVGGVCLGAPTEIAVGYATIDNVNDCNLFFPQQPGYFADGGQGEANNNNQLWGDFIILDRPNDLAFGDALVHIEAEGSVANGTWAPGDYTYYGRFNDVIAQGGAVDNREPLASTWATRYLKPSQPFTGGTDFLVWRDSKVDPAPGFATCGVGPSWYPLNETQVVAFNEKEDAQELCFIFGGGVISPPDDPTDPTCFPLETQRVTVGEGDLDPLFNFGWMYLNLNHTVVGGPFNPVAQSWVTTTMSANGLFSVGYSAIQLTSACSTDDPIITGDIAN